MPKNLKRGVALAVLACIASPSVSFAQESVIEEIVVTATKRSQTLQETPVAVTVTSAETIEQAQILDINDLQSVVPSLRINTLQSSTNTNFVIRGFGNGANNPGIEPSVGVFVDGVYRSRSAGAIGDLPTLERVEVLNGPQSTLFGKNASAGVISVITAKPSGETAGKISATIGNLDARVIKAEFEEGVTDTFAYKVSGSFNQRDGYANNLETGGDINNKDRFNVRGDFLFTPNDNLEIRVIADFDHIDEECCATVNLLTGPSGDIIDLVAGGEGAIRNDDTSRNQRTNIDPTNEQDNYGLSAQVDYDFGDVALTSITSYRKIDSFSNIDADFTAADLITNDLQTDIETFTQEFRLTSTAGDKIDWQIGLFYFNEEIDFADNLVNGVGFRPFADTSIFALAGAAALADPQIQGLQALEAAGLVPEGTVAGTVLGIQQGAVADFANLEALLATPNGEAFFPAGGGVRQRSELENEAISIFGQLDYHFNDRLTGSVGFNYTYDEKDVESERIETDFFSTIDLSLFGAEALQPLQFLPPFVDFPNDVESGSTDDDELTYTIKLAYEATDNINLYASYATGFKASSADLGRDARPVNGDIAAINAAGLGVNNLRTDGSRFADPEIATVIEVGAKIKFARGSLNLAIFDQELENFQSNTFIGSSFTLQNAEQQSVTGAEFDLTYYPIDSLKLNFAGTFLDANFDEFTQASGIDEVTLAAQTVDLSGETPAGIHEVSLSLAATYSFNIASNDAYVRADFQYEDEIDIVENVPSGLATRETKNLNLAAGLTTPSGYNVSLWARNVTDHETLISAFPTVAQGGSFNGYLSQPRTYGITFGKEF